jgi:hypothetical protein
MRRLISAALAAGAIALAAGGCAGNTGSSGEAGAPARHEGSAAALTSAAGRYMHVDYEPLASPADAVRMADLIVTGTVADIVEGVSYKFADPALDGAAGHFTTFVVTVDQVLAGTGVKRGDRVYASVRSSVHSSVPDLAALNPKAKAVLVMEDITTWKPHPAARVVRPAAVPATAKLYAPFPDGMWLQGPRDARMASVHAEPTDLASSFGAPRTVEQFAATLAVAAKRGG